MKMTTPRFIKKATLALATVAASLFIGTALVSAIPYDANQTAASPVPAFNVFTGVPSYGDESDFLRAHEVTSTVTQYVDPLASACKAGDQIQMRVYIHNGASKDANNNGTGPSVAKDVRVKVALPGTTADPVNASISASNAATVNDTATINCNGKTVKLKYVAGSAAQSSIGTGRVALSDDIVTNGVAVRSQAQDGSVYGCWDERVYVILTVKVEDIPVEKPPVVATCDMFKIETADDRTIRVSQFKYTATNANYKHTVINWDAGKTNDSTAPITDATKVVGQTHKYTADGTYLITATVHFSTADTADLVASTDNCQQQVTFKTKTPPVIVTSTPPAKPKTLVNTGAGSTVAIFGAVTAIAAGTYQWALRRRIV